MIKCTFLAKENDNVKMHIEMKTQAEIDKMLINQEFFSIKVVDEYILIDREIPREEHEELLLPFIENMGRVALEKKKTIN